MANNNWFRLKRDEKSNRDRLERNAESKPYAVLLVSLISANLRSLKCSQSKVVCSRLLFRSNFCLANYLYFKMRIAIECHFYWITMLLGCDRIACRLFSIMWARNCHWTSVAVSGEVYLLQTISVNVFFFLRILVWWQMVDSYYGFMVQILRPYWTSRSQVHMLADNDARIKATALHAITSMLQAVEPCNLEETLVFIDYVFPELVNFVKMYLVMLFCSVIQYVYI